jgi:hypothetical protein
MDLLDKFPDLEFEPAEVFEWRPDEAVVTYDPRRIDTAKGRLQLLHEIGHARLGHQSVPDASHYAMERAAWEMAKDLAARYQIRINHLMITRQLQELRQLGY